MKKRTMEIFSLCCTESEKKVHSKMLLNMLDIFSKDQSQTILTNMIKILNVKSSGNFTKAIVSLIDGKAKKNDPTNLDENNGYTFFSFYQLRIVLPRFNYRRLFLYLST